MMIDDRSSEPVEDLQVEPDQLDAQAAQFVKLGDTLRLRVDEPQPAQLGMAPPARWLSRRLASLAGPDGATGMLLSWADGLIGVGQNQHATADRYRQTDDGGAAAMNQTDTSGPVR
jgi:hypothetical protein